MVDYTLQEQDRDAEGDEREIDLLTDSDEKGVARAAIKLFRDQSKHLKRIQQVWKVARLRRMGVANVQLVKDQNTHQWMVWTPPGQAPATPSLNKADRLCRRLRSTMFADPALPEATPSTDSDEDRASAEFSTRALQDQASEGNLDDPVTAAQAFDLGSVYGSGFRRYWVDPGGGGSRKVRLKAGESAETEENAVIDPQSGADYAKYVLKYLTEDGNLTLDASDEKIRRQDIPKIYSEVLSGRHVRFLPRTAKDIWDAEGAIVAAMVPVGKLTKLFPEAMAKLSDEDLKKLVTQHPEESKQVAPSSSEHLSDQKVRSDALVFTVTIYYDGKRSSEYRKGLYLVAAGKETLLHRQTWDSDGDLLEVPIDQIRQYDEEDNPYGTGLMTKLGPGNEIRSAQIGTMLEHLDRFVKRKVFYPITSALQPRAMQAATGTYIPINPGGAPTHEQIPEFPQSAVQMFDTITNEMDDESGLQQTAQGLAPTNVESGLHAQQIIEQVNVGLSDLRTNIIRGLTRGWRIQLQLMRAYFTAPQLISWVGEDGAHKQKQWVGSDLGGTKDVRISRGSFTQLAPSSKAALANALAQVGMLTAVELKRITIGNVGGIVGVQDDPHHLRIQRQIARWQEGPPEGPDDLMGQIAAQIFAPLSVSPPQSPEQAPEGPSRLVDEEQSVAFIRHHELARLISGTRYSAFPPAWRIPLEQEYERMRIAAGQFTLKEKFQMQQQMQQGQMQAAQAQAQADQQIDQAKLQLEDKRIEAMKEQAQIQTQGNIEQERVRAQASQEAKELDALVELATTSDSVTTP